jgi:hypothetical protein
MSPNIRKEGVSKFFIMEKSEKGAKEETTKKKNQYLNPMELSEHIY